MICEEESSLGRIGASRQSYETDEVIIVAELAGLFLGGLRTRAELKGVGK
jgi:hypothetical protein